MYTGELCTTGEAGLGELKLGVNEGAFGFSLNSCEWRYHFKLQIIIIEELKLPKHKV
jgi:hypothetical protein